MWPIATFESNARMIPEFANPGMWSGILALVLGLAFFVAILAYVNARIGQRIRGFLVFWAALLLLMAAVWLHDRFYGNALSAWCIICVFAYTVIGLRRIWKCTQSRGAKMRLWMLASAGFGAAILGFAAHVYSFAYHLPASYPPEERDQLRMIRRVIEAEPHGGDLELPLAPLSQLHLSRNGEGLIPASIRERGEYQDYRYTLRADYPSSGTFTLDAVPIRYRAGMVSYHAFPTNPEGGRESLAYIIYCISMADKGGAPATEKDRHFHQKGIRFLLTGK